MSLAEKLFGSFSDRELKKINPLTKQVLALEGKYQAMSDAELQAQTPALKQKLADGKTLDDILPDAFAVCREAAWRVLGMKHFPVQVTGGIALHRGDIAEMQTGEGKTLVATLPAYLNALTGEGVHIVTVNDYLAKRDSEWMGKLYRWLGLSVGLIVQGMDGDARREAYNADITYGTNNEFGFDYLRDNMVTYKDNMVQRGHAYAVVDEVDSILIDEIDAIGKKRDGQVGGNDEREQTLNQLLTEMDGFEGNNGVIILAATNRPESLDPALTRPGRFDRRVPVELPDLKGREEILKVHARKIKVAEDVDYNKIARMASGASGAELANIVNEAALRAVRDGRRFATQSDLEESIEVVIAGYQKKNAILTDKEKWTVAYHEIGHALVAALQTHSAPVQKITIIPRTSGALGYTMQVEEGNHYLMTKEELENKIATLTGGRAAEEVRFGVISTGASNDIEQATKLARGMITRYGMSEEFDMVALETVTNQYLGGDASLACSAETQTQIDHQVVALVKKEHAKAVSILTENRAKLDELAKYLYEKETITGEEFMAILDRA